MDINMDDIDKGVAIRKSVSMDSTFHIGFGHKVCEDYAWSGTIHGYMGHPCAIISDGCSSSNSTDVGSRLLVHAIKVALNSVNNIGIYSDDFTSKNILKHTMTIIRNSQDSLQLDEECFDATLRLAMIYGTKLIMLNYGDGYTILKNHTTGEVILKYTKYEYNAPFYLSYKAFDTVHKYVHVYGNDVVEHNGDTISVDEHINSDGWEVMDLNGLSKGIWTVTVMSDGVETFFEGNNKVDFNEVLEGITSFKNFRGEFIQRKVGKYLNGLGKNNIKHYDDISVASIKFEVE